MQLHTRDKFYTLTDVTQFFSRSASNALKITLSGTMGFCHVLHERVLCGQDADC
jgi:hypothetical protein